MSVLTGKEIIKMGIVKELKNIVEQVQPAGVDLTLEDVEKFVTKLTLDANNVELSKVEKINPSEDGFYELAPGAYKINYSEIVSIPEDCVGLVFPRSSLLRSGVTIYTAVWDPGYTGRGSGLLQVLNPYGARIKKGSRVVQLIVIKTSGKPEFTYSGRYNKERIRE